MPEAHEILLVIPTLGTRVDYLRQTITSMQQPGLTPMIRVVVPPERHEAVEIARRLGADVLDDPGSLPAAINAGLADLPPSVRFVSWLGDDDLLTTGSLAATRGALEADEAAVLAYGACQYVDDTGAPIWVSRAGRHAQWILPWGPDLIPQPGMLVRAEAWTAVGGLDESLRFAFDLDLLLKLKRVGSFVDVGCVVSRFRWHADSLTVSDRTRSLDESDLVKRRYLKPGLRRVAWTWEVPVRAATRIAAWEMNRRVKRLRGRVS